jgi:type II secretory pathway pseudopilin PulG
MNPPISLLGMDKRKLAIAMSILAMLMVANPHIVFAQTTPTSNGYVIYIDPITAGLIILIMAVVIALGVYIFMSINSTNNQTQLTQAQIMALNSQTNAMNQLVASTATALNVATALNAESARHTMDMDNKYFSLIQQDTMHRHYTEDRYLNIYNKQVDNNIYFMNTLLSLYGLQLVNNDIRQLMSDRLKATLAQYAKPPEVEVTTITPTTPFPTQQPSQGQTQTTGSSK